MALDPSIALGVKPLEVANPVNQFAQIQQLQGLRQANQLNELKMQEAQAANEERNALRQLNPANADYENQLFKVNPQLGIQYRKERTAAEAQAATAAQQKVTAAETKQKMLGQAWRDISGRPSDANIIAHLEDIQTSPLYDAQEKASIQKKADSLLAMPLAERKLFLERMGSTSADYTSRANNAATVAATIRGQDLTNARAQENIKIAQENQRREADPEFQQKLAEAKALGTNMAKDKVLRATQLPKVLDTAEMTLREIDDLIGKRNTEGKLLPGEKPHPGFETAVGATYLPGARFVPGAPAADFQKRFDQIKGGAFLQAFETLKGGGSITNVEGDKGTAALNRMDLAQSEKEFVQAAREFQDIVRKGVERANKLAGAPAATPATPATPVQSVVRVPANAITNPQFPGFSITPGTP
jgi:hypothetical protein